MDPHVIQVCLLAVGFVFVVSGLGDKPRNKRRPTARKPPARAPKPLPHPTRR